MRGVCGETDLALREKLKSQGGLRCANPPYKSELRERAVP